jgi:hypothetical protein
MDEIWDSIVKENYFDSHTNYSQKNLKMVSSSSTTNNNNKKKAIIKVTLNHFQ